MHSSTSLFDIFLWVISYQLSKFKKIKQASWYSLATFFHYFLIIWDIFLIVSLKQQSKDTFFFFTFYLSLASPNLEASFANSSPWYIP